MASIVSNLKVSIVAPTYNQEKYIREALDGFIKQKTDFDFEIIVADDCSTDRTPQIIEEYAKAYPTLIRPILRKKNIGVAANFKNAFQAARGTYIALCEGDDYWTDPNKLQLQADLLDKNPAYALCFHPVKTIYENNEQKAAIYPDSKEGNKFTVEDLLRGNYIQTNSVMYRRQTYKDLPEDILPVDWYLHLYHAQFGKIGFIDQVMAVYRRHPGGLWWNSHKDIEKIWQQHGLAHLRLYEEFLKLVPGLPDQAEGIIIGHVGKMFLNLAESDKKNNTKLLEDALLKLPALSAWFIANMSQELEDNVTQLKHHKAKHQTLGEINQQLTTELHAVNTLAVERGKQVENMRNSRVWKLRNVLARLAGKQVI